MTTAFTASPMKITISTGRIFFGSGMDDPSFWQSCNAVAAYLKTGIGSIKLVPARAAFTEWIHG
ncbi:MAG: hypothetical protein GY952_15605 [Rhodobacteraceae bacterium]|nr:hypothetical protein [Paracoccaceae bacterium]